MTSEEIIKKATELFQSLGLSALRIRDNDAQFEIEMRKNQDQDQDARAPGTVIAATVPASQTASCECAAKAPETAGTGSGPDIIKAPLVGVFYAAPGPGQPAFVRPGTRVKKGDVLCIIEAMKMMNEIKADFDCEIAEVCADNGVLVEYGQMLFKVKR